MINNLTGVRAFAALWVTVYHLGDSTGIAGYDLGWLIRQGQWGVDIFFVLSGLILAIVYCPHGGAPYRRRPFDFIVKRFAKIYPLHAATFIAALGLWFIAKVAGHNFTGGAENTFFSAIANIFLIHAWGVTNALSWNGPSWSISAEWFAYVVLFPMCVFWLLGARLAIVAWLVAIAWLALYLGAWVFNDGVLGVTTVGILRIVPEFLAGFLLYRVARQEVKGDLFAGAGILGILATCYLGNVAAFMLLPSVIMLLFGLLKGGPVSDRVFGNPTVVFLGEISYALYMTHNFVVLAGSQFFRRVHLQMTVHPLTILAVELAACVVVGYLGYVLIEKPGRVAVWGYYLRLGRTGSTEGVGWRHI